MYLDTNYSIIKTVTKCCVVTNNRSDDSYLVGPMFVRVKCDRDQQPNEQFSQFMNQKNMMNFRDADAER